MRILVTGASGFLGRFVCNELIKQGSDVTGLSSKTCDLRDFCSLSKLKEQQYDSIIHLAAWTQAGDFCVHHPGEQWINNQSINTNLLRWWCQFQPQAKLISIGTSCSYDPTSSLSEENYLLGRPIESLYTYAMTKRMLHIGQMAAANQFQQHYLTVVPSTLYGPDYHTDGRQLHFIFDLIRKIVRGKLYGSPVLLWGDGHQRREIVHVEDFAKLLSWLAVHLDNDVINVGAGEDYAIRDFAKMIADHVNYDASLIQYDESRYTGARSKCLSTWKLRSVLPDVEMTPISKGLPATIDWFVEHMRRDSVALQESR